MKNSQKGFIASVLLVIILLVISVGIYIYKNKKSETPDVVDTETQTQQKSNSKTDTKIESEVDWFFKEKLSFEGIGPIKIGMSLKEISEVVGPSVKFISENSDENSCLMYTSEELLPGLSLMIKKDVLVRIDVFGEYDKNIQTAVGVKVGDSEKKVKQLYPSIKMEPYSYEDQHYLTVTSKDGLSAIIFETDGKNVSTFRAGKFPEVSLVEGCL